jgi:hypothetical protein
MIAGAWVASTAVVLKLAVPQGFTVDGKTQHWAPMWIAMVLGLSMFSLGLILFILQRRPISSSGKSAKSR